MKKLLLATISTLTLLACTPTADENTQPEADMENPEYCVPGVSCNRSEVANNPNSITLSNETQEEQMRSRRIYSERQAEIARNREEITNVDVPDTPTVNVAESARNSTNNVGERIYSRSGNSGNCRAYSSSYDAQSAFLGAGGPQTDTLGLDPDGDGFACSFNPTPYRNLNRQVNDSPWAQ